MGNILDKVSSNKTESIVALSAVSVLCYLIYEARQKRNFRNEILEKLMINVHKDNNFANQMNKVYLKQQVEHLSIRNNAQFPIYKVAITGGPCAGKSTSLDRIRKQFSDKGYRVFSVPQIPTMVVVAGGMILMSKFNIQERVKFQSLLMRFQMYAQDYFTKLAEMSKSPSIILCDRGVVDPYAYISKQQFQAIMDQQGWSWVTLRDRRYDRVIFLSSAANGAQQFYSLDNNVARSQGIQVARALDKKTLEAWTGHPHLTVIANVKGQPFSNKIQKAVRAVEKTVGIETQHFSYQKIIIKQPVFPEEIQVQISQIQQIFLVNQDARFQEDKIKKRGQNNSFTYQRKYRTQKNEEGDYKQEIRKPLTSLQYVLLKEQSSDPQFNIIQRKRINFVWNNLSYAIDVYPQIRGEKNVHLLRFITKCENKFDCIPPFIEWVKQVKKDKAYNLRQIARKID